MASQSPEPGRFGDVYNMARHSQGHDQEIEEWEGGARKVVDTLEI